MHPGPALALAGAPGPGALLGHPDQHDAGGRGKPLSVFLDEVVLALAFPKLDPRDPPQLTPGPKRAWKAFVISPNDRRRGYHPAPGPAQEGDDPALALQAGDVAVEIQPVHTLHVEGHMV
jgi:hypothetical protein